MPSWQTRKPRRRRIPSRLSPQPLDDSLFDGKRVAIPAAAPARDCLQRRAPAGRSRPPDSLVETETFDQLRLLMVHPGRSAIPILDRCPFVQRVRERVSAPRQVLGDRRPGVWPVVKQRDLKIWSERAKALGQVERGRAAFRALAMALPS